MENKILIIDIEISREGRIVEIGISSLDLKNGDVVVVFDKVVHETGITKEELQESWIIENSSLTIEEIRQSPNLRKVSKEVQDIINAHPAGACAFNNSFDFRVLKEKGFVFPKILDCLMKLSGPVCQIPPSLKQLKTRPRLKFKDRPNMQEAYGFFFPGEIFKHEHRGANDSVKEALIAYELFKLGVLKV